MVADLRQREGYVSGATVSHREHIDLLTRNVRAARRVASFGYVPALDGVRAIAIVLVMLVHANLGFGTGGWLGVDMFFMLSGFLITSILLKEWTLTGAIDLRRFYINRMLRLFPALAVFVVVVTAAAWVESSRTYAEISKSAVFSITYLANWAVAFEWVYLGPMEHLWSLAIEEQFYLVWPLLMLLCLARIASPLWLLGLPLCLIVGSVVARVAIYHPESASSSYRTYAGLDTRADTLLIGCLLALVLAQIPRQPASQYCGAISAVALSGLGTLAFTLSIADSRGTFANLGGYTLIALISAALVFGLIGNQQSMTARLLALTPMVWLGRRSYSIYLWHLPIFSRFHDNPTLLTVLFCVTTSLVLGELSYRIVEVPFLRLKRGWVETTPSSSEAAQ